MPPRRTPQDPDFERRVRKSYARQKVMGLIGAVLETVEPGDVVITLPFRADLTQQHGFIHAGIVSTIIDSACGYAAFTLMPVDAAVLAIEFKINFLSPAAGERLVARGQVARAGRTISVCSGEVHAETDGCSKLVATMLSTVMAVQDREGIGSNP